MLKTYDGATIIYDNSGNPTNYMGDTMQWTNNQLMSQTHGADAISYRYNESGLRTYKKVAGGTETKYIWKDGVLCAMKIGTTMLEFSYSANGDVLSVMYRPASGTAIRYYYARNAQGDIIGIVNSSGTMVIRYTYDSWGKLVSTTGTATIGTLNPFRYRGYIYDKETGLYYLKTRYYDPEVGRFINADVLMSTGQGVLGCNMFCYCLNNPVNMADESGCMAIAAGVAVTNWWNPVGWIAAAVVVAGVACIAITAVSITTTFPTPTASQPQTEVSTDVQEVPNTATKAVPRRHSGYHLHHIVAQNSLKAAPAREILNRLSINVNAPENLVLLPAKYHARLHTNLYYNQVNAAIGAAYNSARTEPHRRANVIATLYTIKQDLLLKSLLE